MSLANGNLVALDQETGETLWTFETGMPLVSSTPPSTSGSETDEFEAGEAAGESGEGAAASRQKDSIFPGTDGSLYAYRPGQEGAPPRIEVRRRMKTEKLWLRFCAPHAHSCLACDDSHA